MSRRPARRLRIAALLGGVALLLSGCAYDYLQHTDRVGYNAGDAVKANLERETSDPGSKGAYSTGGLGKNGVAGASSAP